MSNAVIHTILIVYKYLYFRIVILNLLNIFNLQKTTYLQEKILISPELILINGSSVFFSWIKSVFTHILVLSLLSENEVFIDYTLDFPQIALFLPKFPKTHVFCDKAFCLKIKIINNNFFLWIKENMSKRIQNEFVWINLSKTQPFYRGRSKIGLRFY